MSGDLSRVIPISLIAGKLTFGEGEKVLEYAVKMRKLQDRYFILRLLERNQVGTQDLDRIVSKLKEFYEGERPTQKNTKWGRIERLKISTDENFDQTRVFVGLTISRPAFEAIVLYTAAFYAQNAQLFESRVRGHRIRDCHGDLHLEHVHLAPKALSIYDCITNLTIDFVISMSPTMWLFWRWTLTNTIDPTCRGD